MKNIFYIHILIASIIFCFTSCGKEDYQLQNQLTCAVDSILHPDHQKYQAILDQFTSSGITGMTTIISKPGEEDWIGSSGYASIEENIKMTNCNIHQTASLVKSFVGVMTLQLIEEGQLSFDTKISEFLDADILELLPNAEAITIKQLLQQTSGLPDIFDIEFIADFMNNPEKEYTRKEMITYIKNKDELSSPGQKHNYADTNYMLLSLIIDQIEGSHINALQFRITEKLQLNNTYYHNGDYPNIPELPQSYWDQFNTGDFENISQLQKRATNYIIGSDGIISSPMDMVHFYKSVFEGLLLTPEMLNIVINEKVEETLPKINNGYSHGFMTIEEEGQTWIGHAGSQLGTSCFVFYNLENKITIAAFTNTGTFLFNEKEALIFSDLWRSLKNAIQ